MCIIAYFGLKKLPAPVRRYCVRTGATKSRDALSHAASGGTSLINMCSSGALSHEAIVLATGKRISVFIQPAEAIDASVQ